MLEREHTKFHGVWTSLALALGRRSRGAVRRWRKLHHAGFTWGMCRMC